MRYVGLMLIGLVVTFLDDEPKSVFLDIQPKGNQALAEDIAGIEGNNLKDVPQGEQTLEGVRFKIGPRMIELKCESKAELPEKATGIAANTRFNTLHILHATEFGEGQFQVKDGTEIGAYIVHYADDTTERIPIRYGEDLRDWWENPNNNGLTRAKVAWKGTNALSAQNQAKICLYRVAWENPHPDKQVTTIDFVSNATPCAPFLVALTAEQK